MKLPAIKNNALLHIDAAGAAVCLLMSLLVCFVAIGPLVRKASGLAHQRQDLAAKSENAAKLKASAAQLERQLSDLVDDSTKTAVKLRPADRINTRAAELTKAFSDCSLEVDDVRIGRTIVGPRFDIVPIGVTGSGGYRQSAAFLRELGRTLPDMGAAKLELWADPTKPQEPRRFHFELLWYTTPQKVAAAN